MGDSPKNDVNTRLGGLLHFAEFMLQSSGVFCHSGKSGNPLLKQKLHIFRNLSGQIRFLLKILVKSDDSYNGLAEQVISRFCMVATIA